MLKNLVEGSSGEFLRPLLNVRVDRTSCVDCEQFVDITLLGHGVRDNHPFLEFMIMMKDGARRTRVSLVQSGGSGEWSSEVLVECVNDETAAAMNYIFHAETEFNLGQANNWSLRFSPHNTSRSANKKRWMYTKGSGKNKSFFDRMRGMFSS